ncbi:MAG: hypothetical protein B7Y39_00180 [Bdellovibrio sp. 28-41-41]|nr:MAG: hypothetical protein B7Y39_00180 [Bdellovibrio sp. 28-41-41]
MVNMSTAVKNQRNKDQGPWSIVLSVLLLAIAFHASDTYSQNAPGTKAKPTAKSSPNIEEADDNVSDDSEEDDEAPDVNIVDENAADNEEEKPVVAAPAAKPEDAVENETSLEAGDNIEDNAPVADQPPVETVPVEPIPQPEPYIPTPTVEALPLHSDKTVSEADMVEVIPMEKTVEVEPFKGYKPYRQRRATHGLMFNVNAENLYFQDYTSIVDQKLYEELFGQEDLTLVQVQLDYKLNFFLGSLVAGVGYGQGTLVDDRIGEERSLTIAKKSGRAQLLFDSLMKEPYFVPYVGFNFWQFGITEENTTLSTKNSYDTGNGTSLTVGFLVQLNWMDPQVAKLAYLGEGLENTYLDVFWTQYQNTDNELDPIFENDFNFGVGLRMEF